MILAGETWIGFVFGVYPTKSDRLRLDSTDSLYVRLDQSGKLTIFK
jgi:hypothetical protein